MVLSSEKIQENYNIFKDICKKYLFENRPQIEKLLKDYEDKLLFSPASSYAHYHNAFPGGYIDHVLRVINFAVAEYSTWKSDGLRCDFTPEELVFSAVFHDFGKLGLPEYESYVVNPSKWHRENLGKLYEKDKNQPWLTNTDATLFILQRYNIQCTLNEYYAIRLHDGLYEDSNKTYYISQSTEQKLRSNIPYILHIADMKAARFEFERWIENSSNSSFYNFTNHNKIKPSSKPNVQQLNPFADIV